VYPVNGLVVVLQLFKVVVKNQQLEKPRKCH